jgi:CubicO group peptidase (beta-lactamase class C family)
MDAACRSILIGMQDYSIADGHPMTGHISQHAAYHVSMSARDMARFGLLYLNNGRWKDQTILRQHDCTISRPKTGLRLHVVDHRAVW